MNTNTPQSWTEPSSRGQQVARLTVIAFAAWLMSLPLTIASGSAGVIVGTVAALSLIDSPRLRRRLQELRVAATVLAALLCALLLTLAGQLLARALRGGFGFELVGQQLIDAGFDPLTPYALGEFIAYATLAAATLGLLRLAAQRSSAGQIGESLFVACAVVLTFAAHRNGMIDRPFLLGDFALIRGYDPAYLLMALGVAGLLVIAAVNLREASLVRRLYHLGMLSAACLLLVVFVQRVGLPLPELTNDLGLTAARGSEAPPDNPFQDSSNDPKDKAAPVAVVVFHDDYTPPDGSYYFRESAYSQFNGTRIDYATRADMDTDLLTGFDAQARAELGHATNPIAGAPRQSVRTTIGTLVPHRSLFGLDTPTAYRPIANPNATRFRTTYEASSAVPLFELEALLGREAGSANWSAEVREEYLKLPNDPRYQTLADSLTGQLNPAFSDDPFARAWVIKQYLDENGIYSLKNAHAAELDPAASFLFGDLTGYCVHFAFSAVYLYRSIGIPARVGVGYSVPASNRAGGSSLLIQAIHGHAWPEVYFEGLGWVIIDPAPQQTLVDMSTDPQDNLQQLLGDMLRDDASLDEFLAARAESEFDLMRLTRQALNLLLLAFAAALMSGYAIKLQRRLAPRLGSSHARYRSGFRATLDRLADSGLSREFGESREAFAQRCGNCVPTMMTLTRAHLGAALSRKDNAAAAARADALAPDWRSLENAVNDELRKAFPLWRRLLGALNPFSWLAAR
jgi:transglutaminase-like putative cysteine protease